MGEGSVGKTESHNFHSERSERGHECGLPFISWPNVNLIVTQLQIKLGEEF